MDKGLSTKLAPYAFDASIAQTCAVVAKNYPTAHLPDTQGASWRQIIFKHLHDAVCSMPVTIGGDPSRHSLIRKRII